MKHHLFLLIASVLALHCTPALATERACTVWTNGGVAESYKEDPPITRRETPQGAVDAYNALSSTNSTFCTVKHSLSGSQQIFPPNPYDGLQTTVYGVTTTRVYSPTSNPACATTQTFASGAGYGIHCVDLPNQEIEVVNVRDLEPTDKISQQTGKNANQDLIARVRDPVSGQMLANVVVTVSVSAAAYSGSHDHDDPDRPVGALGGGTTIDQFTIRGLTNANGEFKFTYLAPEPATSVYFAVACAGCSSVATRTFNVRVPDLVSMPNSPYYVLIGSTATHRSNHYLTPFALRVANTIAEQWALRFPHAPLLHYNDGSLAWGGVFDVGASNVWKPPHSEHRRGVALDVRARRDSTSVPVSLYDAFEKLVRRNSSDPHYEARKISPTGAILKEEHYHLRLPGVCEYPCKGPGPDNQ